jgi:hypothetical protein
MTSRFCRSRGKVQAGEVVLEIGASVIESLEQEEGSEAEGFKNLKL